MGTVNIYLEQMMPNDATVLYSLFSNDEYDKIFYEKNTSIDGWKNRIIEMSKNINEKNFIIYDTKKPIGWLGYEINNNVCKLNILIIDKNLLRKSYGTYVINLLIANIKNIVKKIVLDVQYCNSRAIKFYENIGFTIIGEGIQSTRDGDEKYFIMEYNIRV